LIDEALSRKYEKQEIERAKKLDDYIRMRCQDKQYQDLTDEERIIHIRDQATSPQMRNL
jgi:hypothetical protein